MKEKYLSLIKDTLNYIKHSKMDHIFLSKEEYDFFKDEITSLKPQKRNFFKENKSTPISTTDILPLSKFPITYPTKPIEEKNLFSKINLLKEVSKNTLLKNKNNEKSLKKESLKDPLKKDLPFIKLEKPKKNPPFTLETKNIIKKISPSTILNTTLDDRKAQNISNKWTVKQRCDIAIFSFQETPQGFLFLKSLSLALKTYFFPCQVISYLKLEKEKNANIFFEQNNLKLIIISDYFIWKHPYLTKNYRENPQKKEHFLKEIPLFLLADLSIYLKEPLLKKMLWSSLCKKIKKL